MLEFENLLVGHCVGLRDNRDEIDFGVESAHELDIKLLEAIIGD